MTPHQWWIIVFLGVIALIGLPTTAESDAPSKEIKPSSASECRVHIEKALEQYWDQSDPSNPTHPHLDHNINLHQQNNNKDDSESQGQNESNKDDDESNEDIPDDDEDEDEPVNTEMQNQISQDNLSNKATNNIHDDEDEDDDDETNEEDDDDETNEEDDDDETNEEDDDDETNEEDDDDETNEENDDDETNEEDEEDDEIEAEENEVDEEQDDGKDQDDDDNEDEGNDEIDTFSVETVKSNNTKNSNENNDNVEDDHQTSDDVDSEDDEEEVSESEFEMKGNTENEDEKIRNIENSEAVSDTEKEEEADKKYEEEDDEDDYDGKEDVEEDEEGNNDTQTGQSDDEIKIEIQIASDKVIGEADRASTGMASEFHDDKPSFEQPQATKTEDKNASLLKDGDTEPEADLNDDDTIENIYEEEEESTSGISYRSRDHIDIILGLDEIATEYDHEEEKLAQNIFKDIKKIYLSQIKPMEMLYKYTDSTTRVLGDAEIFNKPMLIFLGPWSSGKTTIINYLLGIERTPNALKTGTGIRDTDFTVITYGETHRIRSGTELATDWRYAGVQRFGQDFLDHFRGVELPHTLLKKITIVDSPGILENKKTAERGYSLNDAFQWFIDRSDAIYVVLDPSKVDIGAELGSVVDQLKGRDARFLLNKADTIRRSDLMRVVGQLFWNLSPLMSSTEAPLIYAVSLTTKPYHPSAPAKFLTDQEKNYFYDMKNALEKRVESKILYARRHALRVRNHAKMIDCYLATYYRHKSIFSNKRNVAKSIIENPHNYNLFDGFGGMTNVSRFDLPNPSAYKEFFKIHPLYDFKPLASTCSYFRGCPMDKLDLAISKDIPELLAKYKKMKQTDSLKQNR